MRLKETTMGKKKKTALRILYAVGVIVAFVSLICFVLMLLCILNGERYEMSLPCGVAFVIFCLACEFVDAVERRMK